jgi:chromosome segregation ATPase
MNDKSLARDTDSARDTLDSLVQKIEDLEAENRELDEECDGQSSKITELDDRIETLEDTIIDLNNNIAILRQCLIELSNYLIE